MDSRVHGLLPAGRRRPCITRARRAAMYHLGAQPRQRPPPLSPGAPVRAGVRRGALRGREGETPARARAVLPPARRLEYAAKPHRDSLPGRDGRLVLQTDRHTPGARPRAAAGVGTRIVTPLRPAPREARAGAPRALGRSRGAVPGGRRVSAWLWARTRTPAPGRPARPESPDDSEKLWVGF